MGVLKRSGLAALVLSFALFATGDSETTKADESKPEEASSSQTTDSQSKSKDTKLAQPPTKESVNSEEEPLERLELDEEIESAANISLPQDI